MIRKCLDDNTPELTFKAIALGCLLALCMAAANIYLVLYSGLTVSASISAAVVSMGCFRGKLLRGTILENNIVQTIASAGESMAAGVAITIPSLLIAGIWTDFQFWPVTLAALFGGLLGVLLMIPLRKALIVEEEDLIYPEGVACAEVLLAGQTGGTGVVQIFSGFVFGLFFKFFATGLGIFSVTVEGVLRFGRIPLLLGCDISPALLSVGFIIGLNVAVLIFLGGAISWIIGVPCYYFFHGLPMDSQNLTESIQKTWAEHVRFIGVGTMIVGALWSIFEVRHGIAKSMRQFVAGIITFRKKDSRDGLPETPRTEQDLSMRMILLVLIPVVGSVLLLNRVWSGSWQVGFVTGLAILATAFLFVAVASYIVGLVGTSNNPISGMTIGVVFFIAFILLLMGVSSLVGMFVSLSAASLVCCAASTAGDVSQDLMTGHLVRATPRRQQLAQILGVILVSFIMAPILSVLHHAYGIGMIVREGVVPLRAPQASLFAEIAGAVFKSSREIPWMMILIGAGVGFALVILDTILKRIKSPFRTYAMPVAVGIYLPLGPAVALFLGGLAAWLAKRVGRSNSKKQHHGKKFVEPTLRHGILVGSGLIAGEAIMGVVVAAFIFMNLALPRFAISTSIRDSFSLATLFVIAATLFLVSTLGSSSDTSDDPKNRT